jgi:hypothetical protein
MLLMGNAGVVACAVGAPPLTRLLDARRRDGAWATRSGLAGLAIGVAADLAALRLPV